MKKIIVFMCIFSQVEGEQAMNFWNCFALHSSHIEKINLKDFVTLAERSPFNSPTSSSLLQFVYGFSVSSFILLASSFLICVYFLTCSENSGEKYVL